MLRSRLGSLLLGLGTVAVLLGTTQASATAVEAPASDPASASASASKDDLSAAYLSCTVPPGYTYTSVTNTTTCSSSGFSPLYNVVKPRTGLWACTVPRGFTYTETSSTIVCSTSGMSTTYLLRAV